MLSSCAERMTYQIKERNVSKTNVAKPYGLLNKENKDKNVEYDVSIGNVVLAIIFIEIIFVPVIIFGWYTYTSTKLKDK